MRPHSIHWCLIVLAVPSLFTAVAHAGGPSGSGTAFTYQGQLKRSGAPVNDICDFAFRLFDARVSPPGLQVGPSLAFDGVGLNPPPIAVVNGLFQTPLDFGSDVFNGDARWLQIEVCCSSPCTPVFSTLVPRQPVTATPYALHTRGISVDSALNVAIGTATPTPPNRLHVAGDGAKAIFAENSHVEGRGIVGIHTAITGTAPGIRGETNSSSISAAGVEGVVTTTSSGIFSVGVRGTNNGTGSIGIGVQGTHAGPGRGVHGTSLSGTGVYGEHTAGTGHEPGVYGETISTSLNATGIEGVVISAVAGNSAAGVRGRNRGTGGTLGYGVHGSHRGSGQGVFGASFSGEGVFGEHTSAIGTAPGVYGQTLSSAAGAVGVTGEVAFASAGALSAGVRGENNGTAGLGFGVEGIHHGAGKGVYGTSVSGTGVHGESTGTSGRGVFGWASAATGNTFGVYGTSSSNTFGRGVFGHASAGSGFTVGVEGQSNSPNGRAVRGWALASTGSTYGVWGGGGSPDATGVLGLHDASTGTKPGVRGKTNSNSAFAVGVHGRINSTSPGAFSAAVRGENLGISFAGIGVWGSQYGKGWGVLGQSLASTGGGIGVRGESSSSSGFDFFAAGAGTDYGSTSSIRWKKNVRNIDHPLDKIARLRGVYYTWDKDHGGQHDLGMIAEEVGKVLPEIVSYEKNGIDAIGLDYSKLTPLLVEAVNALRAEKDAQIEALRKENAAMVARLQDVEAVLNKLALRGNDSAKSNYFADGETGSSMPGHESKERSRRETASIVGGGTE